MSSVQHNRGSPEQKATKRSQVLLIIHSWWVVTLMPSSAHASKHTLHARRAHPLPWETAAVLPHENVAAAVDDECSRGLWRLETQHNSKPVQAPDVASRLAHAPAAAAQIVYADDETTVGEADPAAAFLLLGRAS
eukprot:scaffold25065_cov129-Isochrysis_galbana.AAC.6